ncbi:MAG: hypothetical protein AAB036_05495 [Elusimicrobiota bacterium]
MSYENIPIKNSSLRSARFSGSSWTCLSLALVAVMFSGCASRHLLRPVNTHGAENLKNLNANLGIIKETYIPVMSAYLDFKIQQLRVGKQTELLNGGMKLSPEAQIQLEFYVRDQQAKKKEVLDLLEALLSTTKEQADIANIHLDAYKSFAESGKLTDALSQQLQDSNLQMRALAMLKMDPVKAKRVQELLSEFGK